MVIVATTYRGARALTDQPGVNVALLDVDGSAIEGDATASVLWARAELTPEGFAAALVRLPELVWVHTDTAGVEHLPLADLAAREITVTKTAAYADAVAEWAVAVVTAAAKGLPAYCAASWLGDWAPGIGSPRMLSGTRALVVGAGAVGSRIARQLASLGVTVHTTRRHEPGGSFGQQLPETDWLILACPSTAETCGLVDAAALEVLPQRAWVINVARGDIVDGHALVTALDRGGIEGAVLDAHATEPLPGDSPLWQRANVLVLPHDAWRAAGAGRRQVGDFLAQLSRHRTGYPLTRVADLSAGY